MMRLYAIRGATSVPENTSEDILRETGILLKEVAEANSLQKENAVSIILTSTPDLTAEFPAKACRLMGWSSVPLLGAVDVDVPYALPKCIRIMIHAYLEEGTQVKHIYLNEAVRLRPDLVGPNQIAIDGPAGSGKSTIARMLAERLNYTYIDTGAMYRALTRCALEKGIACDDETALTTLAGQSAIEFRPSENGQQRILLNGQDVTEDIRSPEVSQHVSLVASIAGVRKELVKKQQELAQNVNVVMDGRDICTVVLPSAQCKIFLTASQEERTKRRFLEMREKGFGQDLETIQKELESRDWMDEHRSVDPLTAAKDAVIIDTTNISPVDVVEKIIRICHAPGSDNRSDL